MKNLWQEIKKKSQPIFNNVAMLALDNKVQSISRFAGTVVETIYYTDTKNPLSIGSAVASLWSAGLESFELDTSKSELFVSVNKLKYYPGNIIPILEKAGIFKEYRPKTVVKDDFLCIDKISLPCGDLYGVKIKEENQGYVNLSYYYTGPVFDFEKMFDLLWSKFPNGIYVPKVKEATDSIEYMISFLALEAQELNYIGSVPSLDAIAKELELYRKKNISRSYLCVGPPGTGKTAFSISLAKRFSSRIIKMDPSSLQLADASYVEFILEQLRPDFIIFDDFERLERQSTLLFTVENLKQKYPQVTIIATVNDISQLDKALLRPGRFDEILHFDPACVEDNKKILEFYANKHDIKISKAKLGSLAQQAEGLSGVYIKELCLRVSIQGLDKAEEIVSKLKGITSTKEEI